LITQKKAKHDNIANSGAFAAKLFHENKRQIFIFFVTFIISAIPKFFLSGVVHSAGDQLGFLAGAAYFAGVDWSSLASQNSFIGFGYSALLFPLFLLDLSPFTFLLVIRLANAVLLAFCGVIAYNIMVKIFEIRNEKLAVVAAIASACLGINIIYSNVVWNEGMLIFLNWSILYLLLLMGKRNESGESNIIQSLLLSVLLCYGLLVHTRMLFMWGAVFVFLASYLIIYKKMLPDLRVFLPSFLLLFFLGRYVISYVQNTIWLVEDPMYMANTVEQTLAGVFAGDRFIDLFSADGILALLRTTLGQLYTTFVLSGGLIPLLFAALIICIVCLVLKKTRSQTQELINENKLLFLAIIYTVSHIAAIILLNAYTAIHNIRLAVNVRWLMYDRYWSVAAAPAIVLSIVIFYKMKKDVVKKLIVISSVSLLVLIVLFAGLVAPMLYGSVYFSHIHMWHYGLLMLFRWSGQLWADAFTPVHFLVMSVFAAIITLFTYLLLYKRKVTPAVVLILVFFISNYIDTTVRFHIPRSRFHAEEYKNVVVLFDEADISAEKYPKIYSRAHHMIGHINLQINLHNHSIVPVERKSGYPHFVETSEIPIYVTHNIAVGSGSFNMFFGGEHKLVDFTTFYDAVDDSGYDEYIDDEENDFTDISFDAMNRILVNAADTVLVERIESAGYNVVAFNTLYFDADSLRFHGMYPSQFLAPSNIWLGVSLPAGNYELTISGSELLTDRGVEEFLTKTGGMTLTNNKLIYSFTLDYSITLSDFFRTDDGWRLVENLFVNNIWLIHNLEDMKLRVAERFPLSQVAAYELGTTIYFDEANSNYRGHVLDGLHLQEEAGVWTSGRISEFAFFVSGISRNGQQVAKQSNLNDLIFSFTAKPLVTPSYLPLPPGHARIFAQQVEIIVNGRLLEVLNISRHGTYEVLIPSDFIIYNDRLHIMFHLPTATSPRVLGIDSGDGRLLALFFEEMRIGVDTSE